MYSAKEKEKIMDERETTSRLQFEVPASVAVHEPDKGDSIVINWLLESVVMFTLGLEELTLVPSGEVRPNEHDPRTTN